jgi:tetratricopeptide (TPR) repeat protein
MRPDGRRGLAAVLALTCAAGCATAPARAPQPASDDGLAGWQALADGKRAEAQALFDRRLGAAPRDPIALFGTATIAYERGRPQEAIDRYVAALAAVDGAAGAGELGQQIAPVAAARALALYDELGASARRRTIDRLNPSELARSPSLPWLARVELLRLATHAAREAGDADELGRVAAASGCVTAAADLGLIGPLAAGDLDQPLTQAQRAPQSWRPVTASGCRGELPSTADGRGGARVVRMAFDGAAGDYDVVVDYAGEGRLAIDGEQARSHGSKTHYGPRLAATRVALAAGRHELELRIATRAGVAGFALYVLGADRGRSGRPAEAVRFVDPREQRAPAGLATPRAPAAPPTGERPGVSPLEDYCRAAIAQRTEAPDAGLAAIVRLRARPRFAVGLALAGSVAHDDPTRPASIARDAARGALRAAVSVDPDLARAWHDLASLALEDERPRDAIEAGRSAVAASPGWWAPQVLLARAFTARGLEFDANQAIEAAARDAGGDAGQRNRVGERGVSPREPFAGGVGPFEGSTINDLPCPVIEALRRRAQDRRALDDETRLESALVACGGNVEARVERMRARGDLAGARGALRAALRLDPGRDVGGGVLAMVRAAAGRHDEALAEMTRLVARDPNDPQRKLRLADAQAAAGQATAARETVSGLLASRPDVPEVQRAARALGVPLPLDDFRVDGRAIIRAFEGAAVRYTAPAVMVLDRAVMRIFSSGAVMTMTHQIVRVDSKDAVDKWAEISVPPGAEILTLRTHKRDGTTREPEEIAGKETISAADVAIGDYIEWEYQETRPPSAAFAPGFLLDRFFFQSFDAPMARSELVLVSPAGLDLELDARAGAPRPQARVAVDSTRVTSFQASGVPQLFAERAAVPAIEYVPSVRASAGVSWLRWARYLDEELHDALRSSPELVEQARRLRAQTHGGDQRALAAAMVEWVTENIEATDELADPASFALARGRGSRTALALALAHELGIPARAVLARSRLTADATAPTPPQELDDFADALVELDVGALDAPELVHVDLRLRHAAFGYVPPGLDGARTLGIPDGRFGFARKVAAPDHRTVDMTIRLDEQGGGVAVATEDLAGWPALEWAELVERFGADRARLRQDFEQRWLGVQFPGARLRELDIDLPKSRAGQPGTARVRYSFSSARLAVPTGRTTAGGDEMRIAPTFFRSQPGRRFAAEPQRATGLMLGFDVPTSITATVELPRAARIDEASVRKDVVIARAGGYRFVEDRRLRSGGAGLPNALVLRRESELPIMRVSPAEYADVAADLRRVDGAEQEEIRIRLAPAGRGASR